MENAACRLKPPVKQSTSITSPAKYSPSTIFDCIVAGSISLSLTPPEVTTASSTGRRRKTESVSSLISFTSFARSSLVRLLTFFLGSIPVLFTTTEISLLGRSSSSEFIKSLFAPAAKSLKILLSRVSLSSAGFKSIFIT